MTLIPMKDEEITIEVKYNVIKTHDGKKKRARLEWQAPGLKIYVLGSLGGHLYNHAMHTALNVCENRHIPPKSLRRVFRTGE